MSSEPKYTFCTVQGPSEQQAKSRRSYDQWCPVSRALDVLGDRWTLLILRDLHAGPRRFGHFRTELAGASPTLLSQRLDELIAVELVRHEAPWYELTERGETTWPLIAELGRWGIDTLTRPGERDQFHAHFVPFGLTFLFRPERLPGVRLDIDLRTEDRRLLVSVVPMAEIDHPARRISMAEVEPDHPVEADLVVASSLGALTRLRQGRRSAEELRDRGVLEITGPTEAREAFFTLLAPDPAPHSPPPA